MRSMKTCSFILVTAFILSMSAAFAEDLNTPSRSSRVDYSTGVGKKLGRGIANLGTGWLELPKGIEEVGMERNAIAGVTWGPIYGGGKAIYRTLAGAFEVLTFPFAVPSNFEPLVKPEFMLEDSR